MINMKRIVPITILLGGLMVTGCVSKKQYTALDAQYKDLGQLYHKTQMELTESRAKVKSLEDMLDYERKNNAALKEAYAKLQASLDKSTYSFLYRNICYNSNSTGKLTCYVHISDDGRFMGRTCRCFPCTVHVRSLYEACA